MSDTDNPLYGQICQIKQCTILDSGKDWNEIKEKTKKGLEGSQVEFAEDGQLKWKLKNGVAVEDNPISIYSRYDIEKEEDSKSMLITFYNDANSTWYDGYVHVMAEGQGSQSSRIELIFENFTLLLQTEKGRSAGLYEDSTFHLLNVLEEQQFTDFDVIDKKGGKHSAHKIVLQARLTQLEIDWLNLQSSKVIRLVLHFCYADCLPRDMSLDQMRSCHKILNESPGFRGLCERIRAYLAKHETKQRLTNVLETSERLTKELVQLLQARQIRECHDVSLLVEDIKQVIRLSLSGILHLIVFNHTFHKNKRKLDREEKKELLLKFVQTLLTHVQHIKTGVDRLMDLVTDFISLEEQHKEDLVGQSLIHLHEYHTLAHSLVFKGMDVAKRRKNAKLANLKHVKLLYSSNLATLSDWMTAIKKKLPYIESKVTKFRAGSTTEQVQRVTREGKRLVSEMERVSETCERYLSRWDANKLNLKAMKKRMREFTQREGYVVSYLSDMMRHDSQFEALVTPLIKFIDRADFTACLVELGILSKGAAPSPGDAGATLCGACSLTEPPAGRSNGLAEALGRLLASRNEDLCDLTLVVAAEEGERRQFHLHRAVAGGRCQWLNRALQSGMREAIERRIEIHDVNPEAMEMAIGYMYTGRIDLTEVAPTTIMDLISVADQFEMQTLSRVCADCLRKLYVNEDTAATLLLFADRLQLADLRATCVSFVARNRASLAADQDELLATESAQRILEEAGGGGARPGTASSLGSGSAEGDGRPDEVNPALLGVSDEMALLAGDERRLRSTMETIRDMMGIDPFLNMDTWTQCILAADYDIHRAVNYFFDKN